MMSSLLTNRNVGLLAIPLVAMGLAATLGNDSEIAENIHEFIFLDSERDREIPIRVYLPDAQEPMPVVLFSHGLGGSRRNNAYLGNHWAANGFVAVFLQHPGSDESVWKTAPLRRRLQAMKKAASAANFSLRVEDVPALIDQLERWNAEAGHPLEGRLDLDRIGMSGHSFGAITTQAVSGQSFGFLGQRFTDPRIDAAIAFSPSSPRLGDPARAFGSVSIPWLLMTGTKDEALIVGGADAEARLDVFPHLPKSIDAYELVLKDAEHSAFSEGPLPGDQEPRNPNHHRAILEISTTFWNAYLNDNAEARAWLQGDGARSVLEDGDRWQARSAASTNPDK